VVYFVCNCHLLWHDMAIVVECCNVLNNGVLIGF